MEPEAQGIDLEKEYGGFLDLLVEKINARSDDISHYGVLGMKWGVRRSDEELSKASKDKGPKRLGPDTIERTTAKGEKLTLTNDGNTALGRGLAKISPRFKNHLENSAELTISGSDGKKIGEASVRKKSADELNLVWLEVSSKSRGKGYASEVMQAAADFGRQENFKKLTLEVPGISPDARHIYEKMGFKVTKEPTKRELRTDTVWGGLTEMEYDISNVKQKDTSSALSHYGVPGMKWGVRRSEAQLSRAAKRRGEKRAAKEEQKNKVKNMSDDDLRSAINRMNMERQYSQLTGTTNQQMGARKVGQIVAKNGTQVIGNAAKQVATEYVKSEIKKMAGMK